MADQKQLAKGASVVPTDAQTKRFVELSKHVAHFKIHEQGKQFPAGFKVWGREEDVPRAKQLRDKILDDEQKGLLTPHQAFQLADVVTKWIEEKEAYFASEEYRMRQMTKAFEAQQRNGKHIAEQPFDTWLANLPDRSKNGNGTQKK